MNASALKALIRRSWVLQAAILLVVAVALGAALGQILASDDSGEGSPGTMAVTQENLDFAIEGLCEARQHVSEGDLSGARTAFLDRAHAFLHLLASDVLDVDREIGTVMLQAKYSTESLLMVSPSGTPLAGTPANTVEAGNPVAELIEQVQRAATAIDLSPTGCEEGTR